MKTKILLILLIVSTMSYGQDGNFGTSFSITNYHTIDTKNASQFGLGISLHICKIYFEISSNLAKGKGEELDFSSDYTYSANKLSIYCVNFGYTFDIKNKVSLTPIIGYLGTQKIYQDPVGWDTYYYSKGQSYLNLGIVATIKLGELPEGTEMGFLIGATTQELKFGLFFGAF